MMETLMFAGVESRKASSIQLVYENVSDYECTASSQKYSAFVQPTV